MTAPAWSGNAEVFAYRRLSEHYHSLTIVAPDIASRASPGQFIAIRSLDGQMFLRRAFSIHRVDRRPGWAGTIEIAFDVRGKGTEFLAHARQHTVLEAIGPLGRGFRYPREPANCLLVGGGIGAAPLLFLGEELRGHGHRVDFLMGGRTQEHLLRPIEAKRMSLTVGFTTDDGSVGHRGVVTDLLSETIHDLGVRAVYACGPIPMLKSVAHVCANHSVACQVAWEEIMACGFGACLVCAVPVRLAARGGTEGWTWARCCTEGPVFSAGRIAWDRVGASVEVEEAEA